MDVAGELREIDLAGDARQPDRDDQDGKAERRAQPLGRDRGAIGAVRVCKLLGREGG